MENRHKMSREERAKQFMPFAALKGYPEVLRRREKIVVPKAELSEEYLEMLDQKLRQIQPGDMISVIYFCRGEYVKIAGRVARMDENARYLQVVNTKIPLGDIYRIEKDEKNL